MSESEFVKPEELAIVQQARLQAEDARLRAELALKTAQVATLEVFVRYKLGAEDSFDLQTGLITRAKPVEG